MKNHGVQPSVLPANLFWRGFCPVRTGRINRLKQGLYDRMKGKKFRFSLESVLKLRRYETERARQHFGQVVQARQEQEAVVLRMAQRLIDLPESDRGPVDSATLQRHDAFRQDAQRQYDQACSELASCRQREGEARQRLRQKHGAEESMHRLHEREAIDHKKAQQDAEGAFLDEQAASGYFRKQRGYRPSSGHPSS